MLSAPGFMCGRVHRRLETARGVEANKREGPKSQCGKPSAAHSTTTGQRSDPRGANGDGAVMGGLLLQSGAPLC